MVLPGEPEDGTEHGREDGSVEVPVSRWSARMPTSVGGLAAGIVVCIVVIALCLAALAGALGLLVGA